MSAAVLTIALSGMVGSMVTSMSLRRVNTETALAQQSARRTIEELQSLTFAQIFATYNATTTDDAGLAVAARGMSFATAGLDPQDGDADGVCGEVIFPVTVVGGVPQLREDVVDADLGMPRDLDGDGVVDALDHATNYVLLPVRVRVAWRGVSGARQLDFDTLLCTR